MPGLIQTQTEGDAEFLERAMISLGKSRDITLGINGARVNFPPQPSGRGFNGGGDQVVEGKITTKFGNGNYGGVGLKGAPTANEDDDLALPGDQTLPTDTSNEMFIRNLAEQGGDGHELSVGDYFIGKRTGGVQDGDIPRPIVDIWMTSRVSVRSGDKAEYLEDKFIDWVDDGDTGNRYDNNPVTTHDALVSIETIPGAPTDPKVLRMFVDTSKITGYDASKASMSLKIVLGVLQWVEDATC